MPVLHEFQLLMQFKNALILSIAGLGVQKEAPTSMVTLEQAILPKHPTPPGIKGLIRRLCAKQVKDMMEVRRTLVQGVCSLQKILDLS